jgi:thioredoxin 1
MTEEVIPPSVEDLKAVGIEIPTKGKVVLDIFTEWCGPCKQVGPVLHQMQKDGHIILVQTDLDKNENLGRNHNIHSIPTLIFFKDGKRIGSIAKGEPKEVPITDLLEQVLGGSYEYQLLQNNKTIKDLDSIKVRLTRTLVKDGVMVGFCGEELLREVIEQM